MWLKLHLSDRHKFIEVNEEASYRSLEKYGVPQGSELGPLLFLLYMLPLGDIIGNMVLAFTVMLMILVMLIVDIIYLTLFGRQTNSVSLNQNQNHN